MLTRGQNDDSKRHHSDRRPTLGDTAWEKVLRRLAWVFGVAAAALTVALVVAAVAGSIGAPTATPALWSWLQPSATFTAVACIGLWGAALMSAWYPRRYEKRSWELVGIGGFALLAVVLGMAALAPCSGPRDDVILTPLWRTMVLFVGTSPEAFEEGGNCHVGGSTVVPLAAQAARFAAMAAVFGAAIALALKLGRQQWNRIQVRFQPITDVVIGVDSVGMPLVKSLVDWREKGRGVAVLALEWEADFAEEARQIGARSFVIRSTSSKPIDGRAERADVRRRDKAQLVTSLRPYLVRRAWRVLPFGRKSPTAKNVWIMESDLDLAVLISEAALEVLSDCGDRQRDMRIVVRCDDRVVAQRLRGSWITPLNETHAPWRDAVSYVQVTATEVVGRVARDMHRRLAQAAAVGGHPEQRSVGEAATAEPHVPSSDSRRETPPYVMLVCGDTPLAEAIGAEVALRAWEDHDLAQAWADYSSQAMQSDSAARSSQESPARSPDSQWIDIGQDPDDFLVGGAMPSHLVFVDEAAQAMVANWRDCNVVRIAETPSVLGIAKDWRRLTSQDWALTRGRLRLPPDTPVVVVLTCELAESERHIAARISTQVGHDHTVVWHQPHPGQPSEFVELLDDDSFLPTDLGISIFRADILLDGRWPEDSWNRAARHGHEVFRRRYWDEDDAYRRPWWHSTEAGKVEQETRDDNVRQVRQALRGALTSTPPTRRSWVPIGSSRGGPIGDADLIGVLDREGTLIDRLGQVEHERWCADKYADGWTFGERKDKARKTNPDLRDWSGLGPEHQAKSTEAVRGVLRNLVASGYTIRTCGETPSGTDSDAVPPG